MNGNEAADLARRWPVAFAMGFDGGVSIDSLPMSLVESINVGQRQAFLLGRAAHLGMLIQEAMKETPDE